MGQISQDVLIVSSGSFHFVPSGSTTTGVSQSFDSTPQTYVVTMSGASLSQSVLAPINQTASYFYLRQPDNYALKLYYTSVSQSGNTFTSSVQPIGSLLPNISTPSSSTVDIFLPLNVTGSMIHKLTVSRLKSLPRLAQRRFNVSSSDSKYIFITNTPSGVPPSDDFNLSYISGSSFNYQVTTSGSGLLNQSISEGTPILTSASMVYGLDPVDRQSGKLTLPASSSFEVTAPITAESASFSHFGSGTTDTTIQRARFRGKAEADIFEFTNLTITTANSESYLTKHKDYTDDVPYYKLDISDQGAMFVRIDCALNYPVSRIEPPTVSSTKAHLLFLENATGEAVYISRENQTGLSPGVTDEIGFDTGDFLSPSFKETVLNVPASGVAGAVHGNVTYSSSLALDHGARLMCVRSKFDWKVQSLSDYTGTEVKFADISATSFSGSFTGSINGGVF